MEKQIIKDPNYFQVNGWMLTRLNLSGNDLMCFAIIFGFTQDGETMFSGSLKYLYQFMGASKSTAMRTLEKLEERGLIIKESQTINGVKFNRYRANLIKIDAFREMTPPVSNCDRGSINMEPGRYQIDTPPVSNCDRGSINMEPGRYQNETGGGINLKPNNIVYNKEDNKIEKKEGDGLFDDSVSSLSEKAPPVAAAPPQALVMPFPGPYFAKAWNEWIEYKMVQHKFKYKELKFEQKAVNGLAEMANGSPVTAIRIINTSIGNGWKGFFPERVAGFNKMQQNPAAALPDSRTHTPEQLNDHYAFNPVEYARKNQNQP